MSTTSNRPIVTVAICTWNRADTLRATLEQLTRLRVPADDWWELLVVNNNCTDHTDAVCGEYESRLPIRVLHEPKPGQSRARNLAVAEARGTYVAWTDDDVLVDPEWLTALVGTFEQYGASWVFGRSEPHWSAAPPRWYSDRFRNYFAALDYGPEPFVVRDLSQTFYGLNFAGTRDAHLTLGGFRTEFGFRGAEGGVGEDVDMFERAFRAGMKIVYTPSARVRHVIPADRVEKKYHRRRQWVAGPVYFRHLHEMYPAVPWLLGLPRFFFTNAATNGVAYARTLVSGDRSERFHYELQLLRFARLAAEAVRHGFRRPRTDVAGTPRTSPGTVN